MYKAIVSVHIYMFNSLRENTAALLTLKIHFDFLYGRPYSHHHWYFILSQYDYIQDVCINHNAQLSEINESY